MNEYLEWNGLPCSAEDILREADTLGSKDTWPHYPAGWALAMDTPYQWFKQVASHYGGTRNGLVVEWPQGITARGEIRTQWHHVVDVMPTILECAGIPMPSMVDGVGQQPVDGISMKYSFNDAMAKDRHNTQYFEIHGSRGIYHNGWVACTAHRRTPWEFHAAEQRTFNDDVWELYDTNADWSQAQDLAAVHPERLERLKQQFILQATRNKVFPLDDRPFATRRNVRSERPTRMTFHSGSYRLPPDAIPNTVGRSYVVEADVTVDGKSPRGVICSQGASSADGPSTSSTVCSPTARAWASASATSCGRPTELPPVDTAFASSSTRTANDAAPVASAGFSWTTSRSARRGSHRQSPSPISCVRGSPWAQTRQPR
ncbi:sulfatase-like hydrolase/transferase [Rhodococcus opacus]|nr:sulfatase-like hydrolase/transferase [Rhodococcus opacus]